VYVHDFGEHIVVLKTKEYTSHTFINAQHVATQKKKERDKHTSIVVSRVNSLHAVNR
jgi:hypothetical protein